MLHKPVTSQHYDFGTLRDRIVTNYDCICEQFSIMSTITTNLRRQLKTLVPFIETNRKHMYCTLLSTKKPYMWFLTQPTPPRLNSRELTFPLKNR